MRTGFDRQPARGARAALLLRQALALLALLVLAQAGQAQGNRQSPLGVNVREIRYWGTEMHGVDFFKRAGNGSSGIWLTQNATTWDTREQARLDLDAAGWPRSLPAAQATGVSYRSVATILWMGSDKLPSGRWTVFYDGEGTLAYGMSGVTRVASASAPGRDVFDVQPGATGLTLAITATDPRRTGNHLRNIRVIPPGGTCNHDRFSHAADASACPASFRPFTQTYASEPFLPQFLADLRPFAALRFMQFFSTNLDPSVNWSERAQPGDISWGWNVTRGAPIEVAIDLANTLDASPWLALPAMVNDDYVTRYAQLVKARLSTRRPVVVEYGNEVWNGAYPYSIAAQWVQGQGRARWPNARDSDFAKQLNWFAMRTVQVCRLWKQVFAERADQVRCVMGAQGAGSFNTDRVLLPCPLHAAEPGGSRCDASAGIDAFAVGFYFGGHLHDAALQPAIESQWFTQADGGLGRLFQEIGDGTGLVVPAGWNRARATVAGIATQMAQNKAVADRHGVAMWVYEGGNELAGGSAGSPYLVQLQRLFEAAQRDPRMADAYTRVLNHWKVQDGGLYMVFESTGSYSAVRGNATLLEWTGQPRRDAPKYDAVLSFIEGNACWWAGCSGSAIGAAEADCLFGWAERSYPELFAPPGVASALLPPWRYRHYTGTGNLLGLSSVDGHVWVTGRAFSDRLVDVGAAEAHLATAGCRR